MQQVVNDRVMKCFFMILSITCSVVSVKGQVVCRASFNCAGGPGDELGVAVDGAGCCLGNPSALAYTPQGSEECIACIVVGFLNASFSGFEQGPGHSVPVGYLKGGTIAGQDLVFNVESTPGTAREGSQFDYTVNTLRTSALANGAVANVVFTFRVDSIAQEPNETFTLTLDPLVAPNPREGLFFQNTIEVTIVNDEYVQLSFTEGSYRANEPDSSNPTTFLPILVSKSTRIASRVELVVVPLTVQDAIATSLPLPPNIPQNDPRSPPFANSADFNNINVTIIFEPDEDGEVNEKSASVFVTDDAINEATEQVFVAELILVSSLDPATADLSLRPSTLCRIIDNDPIRIGFELPGYTYTETQFDEFIDEFYASPTGRPENGPIFLLKENNVTSEQTFLVSIQVTDSAPAGTQSATIDQDYRFAGPHQTSQTEFFFPSQQRIPFLFELRADTFPEGTEAFQASVSPEDTRDIGGGIVEQFSTFLYPLTLRSEIFITILDNYPIIVGFTNISYAVDEDVGTLQVDVRVLNPPDDQPLPASVDLVIQSVSGSATGGSDYQEIRANFFDVFLTFDDAFRQHSFDVTIIDDSLFEIDVEDFALELRFDPFALEIPANVILNPNVSTVEIRDHSFAVVIGFLNTSYTVNENDGVANIQIGVIRGSLERPINVQFSLSAISAAPSDYTSASVPQALVFSNSSRVQTVLVPIMNDLIFELSEVFTASLALEISNDHVKLAPDSVSVTITDDDEVVFGLNATEYEVHEGDGSIMIEVIFIRGIPGDYQPVVLISTHNGTATEGRDFSAIVSSEITFIAVNQVKQLSVPIISTNSTESSEEFTVTLDKVMLVHSNTRAMVNVSDQESARLILSPRIANVTILDDNVAVIGFLNSNLTVSGEKNTLNFTIGVLQGYLDTVVTVLFTTEASSAKAGSDYIETSEVLSFTRDSVQHVSVHIIDNDNSEYPKTFFGLLSSASADGMAIPPNIHLEPTRATATIINTNGKINLEHNSLTSTVPAVVLVCILLPSILITSIVVVICLLFKKGKKKKQLPQHDYDYVSPPPNALPSLSEATNPDYDEVKTTGNTQFELTKNAAYSSFKPPSAAETTLSTD